MLPSSFITPRAEAFLPSYSLNTFAAMAPAGDYMITAATAAVASTTRTATTMFGTSDAASFSTTTSSDSHNNNDDDEDSAILAREVARCNGGIIDMHLHTAPWFDDAATLIEELEASSISIGFLFNPYPKMELPYDINTYCASIASASNGKIFTLASLNTTHDDWEEHREFELQRLKTGLEDDKVVLGTKLAPPHTCLPLTGPIMDDVLEIVNESKQKLLAIHIGTTPFCGPIGKKFGLECKCTEEYVNPALLIPKIEQYPNVTFALLHSGHEFLPEDSPDYHHFRNVDECIALAGKYPNVYLSISAIFAQEPDGTLRYPGAFDIVRKMKEAGITHKVFWGSDASYIKGQIRPVLITAIKAMIEAGWTDEERTWALSGCTRKVFNIPIH